MLVYRICKAGFAQLDGEGARLFGGRWNSPGHSAVYTSSHLSLAALELLVHVDFENLPSDLVWLKIEIAKNVGKTTFSEFKAPNETVSTAFGDAWLKSNRDLCLEVPSAVLSVERNIILNPRHAEMGEVRLLETNEFEFDERLFRR
ncbi:MAG: RES domain-containing protein [Leptolyngbya sp.]|nr:RES domain-containing protein [Candidatus Melainabacteria bacterium]